MDYKITQYDLDFVGDLSTREYQNISFLSSASPKEKVKYDEIRMNLKSIAQYFFDYYNEYYGPFKIAISTGNYLNMQGRLRRPWSTIYKGSDNKQYSAQISFVINPVKNCLDVGFYFGRAAVRNRDKDEKAKLNTELLKNGKRLSDSIIKEAKASEIFNDLFDYGFQCYTNNKKVLPNEWLQDITITPNKCEIVASLKPSELGIIELGTIDFYISMLIGLMNSIVDEDAIVTKSNKVYKPLTPEQRAKQAERRTLIGEKGELYIMDFERIKLINNNIEFLKYLEHVSIKSMNFGFDILSCDLNKSEIHIEVKTTTRLKSDALSKQFFISENEYNYFKNNKDKYRLYRVYDIEGNPELEIIDMNQVDISPSIYTAKF